MAWKQIPKCPIISHDEFPTLYAVSLANTTKPRVTTVNQSANIHMPNDTASSTWNWKEYAPAWTDYESSLRTSPSSSNNSQPTTEQHQIAHMTQQTIETGSLTEAQISKKRAKNVKMRQRKAAKKLAAREGVERTAQHTSAIFCNNNHLEREQSDTLLFKPTTYELGRISLYSEHMVNKPVNNGKWYLLANGTRSQGLKWTERQDGFYRLKNCAAQQARKALQDEVIQDEVVQDDRAPPSMTRKKSLKRFNEKNYFSKLPQEIQDEIWRLSLKVEHTHVIRIHEIKELVEDGNGNKYEINGFEFRNNMVTSSLLRTCAASRRMALKHFTLAFGTCNSTPHILVNFDMDRFFFDSCGQHFDDQFGPMIDNMLDEDLRRITQITCRFRDFWDAPYLKWSKAMSKLPALKKIRFFLSKIEFTRSGIDRTMQEEIDRFLNVTKPQKIHEQWKDEEKKRQIELQERREDEAVQAALQASLHSYEGGVTPLHPGLRGEDWDDWEIVQKPWTCPKIQVAHFPNIEQPIPWIEAQHIPFDPLRLSEPEECW